MIQLVSQALKAYLLKLKQLSLDYFSPKIDPRCSTFLLTFSYLKFTYVSQDVKCYEILNAVGRIGDS